MQDDECRREKPVEIHNRDAALFIHGAVFITLEACARATVPIDAFAQRFSRRASARRSDEQHYGRV